MSRLDKFIDKTAPVLPPEEQYGPDSQEFKNELVRQYDDLQRETEKDYNKQVKAIDATNPHTLYTNVVANPTPKGYHEIRIMGRPIDVNALEQYLVFKISPRTITTLMRYNDSKSIEEARGYSKRPQMRAGKGLGLILLISIGAMIMIGIGYLFMNGTIPDMMHGIMGGLGV